MITVQIHGDGKRVRLYNDGDEKMDALLAGIPCAGYSTTFDADAYDVTAEQLVGFLATRLGVSAAPASAPAHRRKLPISEAQRQARRENARKARERRYRAV
jgi:hypothetical protein